MRKITSFKKRKKSKKLKLNATKLRDWAKKVKAKDNLTCQSCKSKKFIHAHHMVSKFYRPKWAFDISNGIALCKSCHLKSGGVHHKTSVPKNSLIKKLRLIFKLNDIDGARKLSKTKPLVKVLQGKASLPQKHKKKLKRRFKRKL